MRELVLHRVDTHVPTHKTQRFVPHINATAMWFRAGHGSCIAQGTHRTRSCVEIVGEATMKRIGTSTSMNRGRVLASMLAVAVIAIGGADAAQRSEDQGGNRTQRAVTNRLTGTYRLNQRRSENVEAIADRAIRNLPREEQQRLRNAVMRRLEAPESLSIERDGRVITMASSHARQVTFEADGREQIERSRNGPTDAHDSEAVRRPADRRY